MVICLVINPEKLWEEIRQAASSQDISDLIMMEMIIYPLTFKGKEAKKEAVSRIIELASKIEDQRKQSFVLSGIYTFADKVISVEDAEKVRRLLHMTKVEQIYTNERIAAVKEARREERIKAEEEKESSALAFLSEGDTVEKVARCLMLPI